MCSKELMVTLSDMTPPQITTSLTRRCCSSLVTPSLFACNLQVSVSASIKELCHKLAELGWLFHKVKQYVEARSRDKAFGLVGQVSSVCVRVCV